jgi:hypothetical protein
MDPSPPRSAFHSTSAPRPASLRAASAAAILAFMLALHPGSAPAQQAQNRFQVVNRTGQDASAVYAVRSGRPDWGSNLAPGPMPNDKALTLRPDAEAGCRFDVRLVLADGREAVLRNQDICATPANGVGAGCGARGDLRRANPAGAGGSRTHGRGRSPAAAASWWRRTVC